MVENENKVNETATQEVKEAPAATEEKAGKKNLRNGKRNFQRKDRKAEPKEYEERVVAINRVTKVVKGGKRMKFSAVVVIGNGNGQPVPCGAVLHRDGDEGGPCLDGIFRNIQDIQRKFLQEILPLIIIISIILTTSATKCNSLLMVFP